MSVLREEALKSKAWPFEEARRVLKRYAKGAPEKVVLTGWEKKVMTQGAAVWAATYAGLGVEFDIIPAE